MNNVASLIALLSIAEHDRDLALADQMRQRARHAAAVDKAEQLLAYRREYEQRWGEQFCRAGNIELVRCYQGFMTRLTQAVDEQAAAAAQAARDLETANATLRERETRAAAVTKLIERRKSEERSGADRQEQRVSDDLSSRLAWDRLAALRQSNSAA